MTEPGAPPHVGDGRTRASAIHFTEARSYEEHIRYQYSWLQAKGLRAWSQALAGMDGEWLYDVHKTEQGDIWFKVPIPHWTKDMSGPKAPRAGGEGVANQRQLFLRCAACGATPLNLEVGLARAMLEYDLRDNPAAELKLQCGECGQDSSYHYQQILALLEPERQPKLLPRGQAWALILVEVPTAAEMPQRGFLGERVLVRVEVESATAWEGALLSRSQFAPALSVPSVVGGRRWSGFDVCDWTRSFGRKEDIVVVEVKQGSVVGTFFSEKHSPEPWLKPANLFCANPSCGYIFGVTFSQFEHALDAAGTKPIAAEARPNLALTCSVCQTSRVIDRSSFAKLFKV